MTSGNNSYETKAWVEQDYKYDHKKDSLLMQRQDI